jgi:hypothetical protein
MRCICHLALAGLVALMPVQTFAQSTTPAAKKKHAKKLSGAAEDEAKEAERAQQEAPHRRRRHKAEPQVITASPQEGGEAAAKADAPKKSPEAPAASAPAAPTPTEEDDADIEENPSKWLLVLSQRVPPRRYAYVLGAALGAIGLVFAYQAQGEAKRAQTITSADEARAAVSNAQASASLANVMYVLAALAGLWAVALEFLPEPAAEKASLTFHF